MGTQWKHSNHLDERKSLTVKGRPNLYKVRQVNGAKVRSGLTLKQRRRQSKSLIQSVDSVTLPAQASIAPPVQQPQTMEQTPDTQTLVLSDRPRPPDEQRLSSEDQNILIRIYHAIQSLQTLTTRRTQQRNQSKRKKTQHEPEDQLPIMDFPTWRRYQADRQKLEQQVAQIAAQRQIAIVYGMLAVLLAILAMILPHGTDIFTRILPIGTMVFGAIAGSMYPKTRR